MKRKRLAGRYLFINIVFSICAVSFTVIAAEIVLRFTPYKYFIYSSKSGFPRYYFRADSKAEFDIAENFPPTTFRVGDYEWAIWSNELGCFDTPYRGEKGYILIVGDSFTWGYVPFVLDYETLIERYLHRRVLKCGVPGYGLKQEVQKVQTIIDRTGSSPRLIIVGYFLDNDFIDDLLYPRYTMIDGWLAEKTLFTSHPEPRKGVIPDHALRSKAEGFEDSQTSERFSVIHLRERAKSWFLGHSVLYNMTRRVRGIRELASTLGLLATEEIPVFAQIDKSKWLKEAWDDHLKSFRELKKISDDNHAELLIVLIPPVQEISESLSVYTSYVDRFSERLRKFFQEERIQYLDLTPFFQEYAKRQLGIRSNARKELYWVYDCHLNVRGNESVGLLVTEYILDHGLIDIAHKEETKREVEEALKEFRE